MRIDAPWIAAAPTQSLCAALTDAGHQALFVGGCVRNALIGAAVSDIDIATDALPQTVTDLAEKAGLRVVPTGIDHGTVTVIADGIPHEVTTFRRDVETHGRRATVAWSADLAEDAARRDFTMNALYARPDGVVVDPLGGLPDLLARRVRFVGDAGARIAEDYLRILRFFRFHAWYGDPGAGIDRDGLAACAAHVDGLAGLSRERVGAEVRKLLSAPDPAPAVAAMQAAGVLGAVLPGADARALAVLVHLEAGAPPRWLRRLAVLGGADPAAVLRLSRREALELRLVRDESGTARDPAEIAYRHGAPLADDVALVRAASLGMPLTPGLDARIRRGAEAVFPVRAEDLMSRLAGPALGAALRAAEDRWIASGFTLGRSDLLEYGQVPLRRLPRYMRGSARKVIPVFRFFENLVDPYVPYPERDVPPRKLWPFLWEYSQPFKKVFAAVGVMAVVVALVEVGLIWYMGRVVDLLSGSDPQAVWQAHKVELIGAALFILMLRPLLQGLDVALLNNTILPNFGTLIRWRAHRQVLRQSVGWFENDFAGRIANRIMQTPPAAGDAVFQVFDAIAFSIAYMIGAAVLLADADPRLALPMLVWLVLYAALVRWTVVRVGPASKASSDARSAVTGRVVDSYANIHSVKMFAHHDRELEYAREAIEKTRQTFAREMRIFTTMDVVLVALNGLLIVSVVGWAFWLWMQGAASVGAVAAASALVLRLNAMTGWIMWALTSFFRALGVVSEGMETIAQPITLVDAADAAPLDFRAGQIEVQGLTHHYGRPSGGLQGVDLVIRPGEKIGLVGRSGAGKSTLVKLLLRFYDPESGRILIDGQDVTRVRQDSLRRNIGMVQQDSSLLHRSVRDNILYGRPDASEAEMIAAARRAEAHDFILTLEDPEGRKGYDAHVGERGVKLSGGQRQRVALARVILKDAPILLLDEATSALDSEVEAVIQDTLYRVMQGKTVVAIAHRLSTIAAMDRIVVLDQGRIVEDGAHADLLARGGLYARFWSRQSGGFIDTEAAE